MLVVLVGWAPVASAAASLRIAPVAASETCAVDRLLAARLEGSAVVRVVDGAGELEVVLTRRGATWQLELFQPAGVPKLRRVLNGAESCDDIVVAAKLIIERAVRDLLPEATEAALRRSHERLSLSTVPDMPSNRTDEVTATPPGPGAAPGSTPAGPPVEPGPSGSAAQTASTPAWGLGVTAGPTWRTSGAVGGAVHAWVSFRAPVRVGLFASLTTADRAPVSIDGTERGVVVATPGTVWVHAGGCLSSASVGGPVSFCLDALAGARVWQGLAQGDYLFHGSPQWAVHPVVGLSPSLYLDLPLHLVVEVGAHGLFSFALPSFGVTGASTAAFTPSPWEVDLTAAVGVRLP